MNPSLIHNRYVLQCLHFTQVAGSAWFTGAFGKEFFFYDLQLTLVNGLVSGIILSMTVAFIIMLLTSGNFFITLYATINIILIITVTVSHAGFCSR